MCVNRINKSSFSKENVVKTEKKKLFTEFKNTSQFSCETCNINNVCQRKKKHFSSSSIIIKYLLTLCSLLGVKLVL